MTEQRRTLPFLMLVAFAAAFFSALVVSPAYAGPGKGPRNPGSGNEPEKPKDCGSLCQRIYDARVVNCENAADPDSCMDRADAFLSKCQTRCDARPDHPDKPEHPGGPDCEAICDRLADRALTNCERRNGADCDAKADEVRENCVDRCENRGRPEDPGRGRGKPNPGRP